MANTTKNGEGDSNSSGGLLDKVFNAAKSLAGNDKVTGLVDSLKKGGDTKGTLQQLYDVCKDSEELKDLGKTALDALTKMKADDQSSSTEESPESDDSEGDSTPNDNNGNGDNSSSGGSTSSSSSEFASLSKETKPEQTVAEMFHDLDEVKVDTAFANEAFNVMASISFDKLIGNPLQAAMKAQRAMAKETLTFIKQDGMLSGQDQLAFVTMVFKQNGKDVKLRVPLITLIPYPSLLISEMKYHFTAKIDALSSVVVAAGNNIPIDLGLSSSGSKPSVSTGAPNGGTTPSGTGANKNSPSTPEAPKTDASQPSAPKSSGSTTLSARYGAGAMRGSRYNVETTMDVQITATQQEQPKGLAHIIDVLDQSVEVINTKGELILSTEEATLTGNYVVVSATYRTPKGDYDPYEVKCKGMPDDNNKTPKNPKMLPNGDDVLMLFSEKGTYTVKAGQYTRIVFVN